MQQTAVCIFTEGVLAVGVLLMSVFEDISYWKNTPHSFSHQGFFNNELCATNR